MIVELFTKIRNLPGEYMKRVSLRVGKKFGPIFVEKHAFTLGETVTCEVVMDEETARKARKVQILENQEPLRRDELLAEEAVQGRTKIYLSFSAHKAFYESSVRRLYAKIDIPLGRDVKSNEVSIMLHKDTPEQKMMTIVTISVIALFAVLLYKFATRRRW